MSGEWETNMDGWTDWTDYVGDLDLNAIIQLGNEWIRMGDALYAEERSNTNLVAVMGWRGGAYTVAQEAWHNHLSVVLQNSADAAWKMGEAINAYAQSIYDQAQKMAEDNNKNYLITIFSFFLSVVTAPVNFAIGAVLGMLVKVIGNLLTIALDVAVGAASTFIIDIASNALASAATHTGVDIDWKKEAENMGLGGAIAGGFGAAGAAGGRFGGSRGGADTPGTPNTPVPKAGPTPTAGTGAGGGRVSPNGDSGRPSFDGAGSGGAGAGSHVPPVVRPGDVSFGTGEGGDHASGTNSATGRTSDEVVTPTSSGPGARVNQPPPSTSSHPAPKGHPDSGSQSTGRGSGEDNGVVPPVVRSGAGDNSVVPPVVRSGAGDNSGAPPVVRSGGDNGAAPPVVSRPGSNSGRSGVESPAAEGVHGDGPSTTTGTSDHASASSGSASTSPGGKAPGKTTPGENAGPRGTSGDNASADSQGEHFAPTPADPAAIRPRADNPQATGAGGEHSTPPPRTGSHEADAGPANPPASKSTRNGHEQSGPASPARRAEDAAMARFAASKDAGGSAASPSEGQRGASAVGGGERNGPASSDGRSVGGAGREDGAAPPAKQRPSKSGVADGTAAGSSGRQGNQAPGGEHQTSSEPSPAERAGKAAMARNAASNDAGGPAASSSDGQRGTSAGGGGERNGPASDPAARGTGSSRTQEPAFAARRSQGTGKSSVPVTRQLFRRDSWTGEKHLVDIAAGRRLGGPPASARPADDAGAGAGGGGADGADRYRYYEVDPATGAVKETHLGPNDQVVNVKPVGGKVTPGNGFYSGKGGAALKPAGDSYERVAAHNSADGKWDVVDLPPKPTGFKNRNVTAHAKPAATSPRNKSHQVLRRGRNGIDLLTYPRRPENVPPPEGAKSDGYQYHELGDGGQDGWHDANPFGAGAPKVERIITAPGKRLDGKPVESSDPPAVLVRDQKTGLFEKIESFASGGEAQGERSYYRIGPDGKPQLVKVSGGEVDVVRVSPNDGKVTRTTLSVSGGKDKDTAKPYVDKDGTLTSSGSQEISPAQLRFDTDTGRVTHAEQSPAGSYGSGPRGGSDSPGGGGRGTATRSKTDGSRTQTQTGTVTFTEDGAAGRGATSSKQSEGSGAAKSAVKKDSFSGEGREAGPSSERPDGKEGADALDRKDPGPADGSGAGEQGSATRPGTDGSRTQTRSGTGRSTEDGAASRGVTSSKQSEGSGAVEKGPFSGEGRTVGSSSEHPDSGGRAEAFERLLGSKKSRFSPASGAKSPGAARPKAGEPAAGESKVGEPAAGESKVGEPAAGSGTGEPPAVSTPRPAQRVGDPGSGREGAQAAEDARDGSPVLPSRTGGSQTHTQSGASSPRSSEDPRAGEPAVEKDPSAGQSKVGEPTRRGTDAGREPALRTGGDSSSSTSGAPSLPLPGQGALVVGGRVLQADNVIVVPGESRRMNPAEFVDWLRNQRGYEPRMHVFLLARDAHTFAPDVASILGAPVTAPWGDFVISPSGALTAGRIVRAPDGTRRLITEYYDGWHTYGPDGQSTEFGRVLPNSEGIRDRVVTALADTGRPVAVWRPPVKAEAGNPVARQVFRTDSVTGDTDLVDIAAGRRLGGPPEGKLPRQLRTFDDASTGAGGGGVDAVDRYRYYEVDPATGAVKEVHLGPNDQVVNVKPVGGKVTPGSGFYSGKGGAALKPAGDSYERVAAHNSADGKWDVVDLPPKPTGFKNRNVTAHAKPAATSPRNKSYQVLRRDGSGNIDLLTYPRRPADVPPPDGAKGDGNQYHELGRDGVQVGWHQAHLFGAGAPKVERIITGPGKRLDGRPTGRSDPDAVLVRDQRTGLYEKIRSFASGGVAGEPGERSYYRIGPDGTPKPIKISGGKVDAVRVSPNDGKVTRTTFSVSGGKDKDTAKPYVNKDGSLTLSGPSEFSAGELRFDTDTGRVTLREQESAGFRDGGFAGDSGGPGGGGKGTATRPKTDGSRTQTQTGTVTFTEDGVTSRGATSSKQSEGSGAATSAVKQDPSSGEGREAGPSLERPDGKEGADAFDRDNPGPADGSGAGEQGSVARPGTDGSRTQTRSGTGISTEDGAASRGVTSSKQSEGSGAVEKGPFSGEGRTVGSSSEHPDSGGRAEAFERLLGSKESRFSPASGAKSPGAARPKAGEPAAGESKVGEPAAGSGTGEPPAVSTPRPVDALRQARTELEALPEERRTQAMRDADILLRHIVGRAPAEEPGGLMGTPLGRARVLVAAEIARSGRAAGHRAAEWLARDPAVRDPAGGRSLPVLRLRWEDVVGLSRARLDGLPEDRRAQVLAQADGLLGDLVGRVPSQEPGGMLGSPLGRARVLVAAELAVAGRAEGESLAGRLARDPAVRGPAPAPPVLRLGPGAAVDRAQARLDRLPEDRRAQVLAEADAVVGDLTGLPRPPREDEEYVTPEARLRTLVAAEIAESGRAAGEALAHRMAPRMDTLTVPFQPDLRVFADHNRIEVARSTLTTIRNDSEQRYAQLLGEARLIVQELAGAFPSQTALRGQARLLTATMSLVAAEIPWAGYAAARRLAADVLGIPRVLRPRAATRLVRSLANAARHDPDRARQTLNLLSEGRLGGLFEETDHIVRTAIANPASGPARARAPREWRLLIAAEIARSGSVAGERLARGLVADTPLPAPPRQGFKSGEPATSQPADGGLEQRIDAAVAGAVVWAGQADQGRPEGPVVAAGESGEWRSRYCWLFLTELARGLSATLPDPVAALHGPRFTAWEQVTGVLAGADPGTSVYVALGNFELLGHGIWIAHLGGRRLMLIDPDQNAANGYTSIVDTGEEERVLAYLTGVSDASDRLGAGKIGSREGLPLIDAHAHFKASNGEDIDLLSPAGPESGSAALAVTDHTPRSGIGMPRRARDDAERWNGVVQAVTATAWQGLEASKTAEKWGQSGGSVTEAAKAAVNDQKQLTAHGLVRHGDRVFLAGYAPAGPAPAPRTARDDEERWNRVVQAVTATAGQGLIVSKAAEKWGKSGGSVTEAAKAAVNDQKQLTAHGLVRHGDRVFLAGYAPAGPAPAPRTARDDEERWNRVVQAVTATAGRGLIVSKAAEKWGQSRGMGTTDEAKAAVNDQEQLTAHGLERRGKRVFLAGYAPAGPAPAPRAPRAPRARDDAERWNRVVQAVTATAGQGLEASKAAEKWGKSSGKGATDAAKAAVNDQEQLTAHGLERRGDRVFLAEDDTAYDGPAPGPGYDGPAPGPAYPASPGHPQFVVDDSVPEAPAADPFFGYSGYPGDFEDPGVFFVAGGVSESMAAGLRASIADRQDQIAADLGKGSGGAVDPVALRAVYDRDPQLRVLRDALASWTGGPHATQTGTDGGLEQRIDGTGTGAADVSAEPDAEAAVAGAGQGEVRVSFERLEQAVGKGTAVGVAAMRSEAGSAGPVPGPQMGQYCLAVIEHIIGALYGPVITTGPTRQVVGGITSGLTRDDGQIEAGQDARRRFGLPAAAWGRFNDWRTVIEAIRGSEPGTAMVVVNEQPGTDNALDLRHVVAFVHTEDGVFLINPTTPGQATTITPLDVATAPPDRLAEPATLLTTVLGPPINSRVLSIDAGRRVITPDPDWASLRESDSTALAMLDPANPRIGMPKRKRAGGTAWMPSVGLQARVPAGDQPSEEVLNDAAREAHKGKASGAVFETVVKTVWDV
ncbi:hypothetical protein Airi02_105830, partial [Actinoallomurus iriomotensis]